MLPTSLVRRRKTSRPAGERAHPWNPTTAPTTGAGGAVTPALTEGPIVAQPVPYDPSFNPLHDPHHAHPAPHNDPGHNPDGTLITHDPGHKSEPTNG